MESISSSTVLARVDRFFDLISGVKRAFGFQSNITFDELVIRE